MIYDACQCCRQTLATDGDGDFVCQNADCPHYGEPFTKSEVENQYEAAWYRSQTSDGEYPTLSEQQAYNRSLKR